MEQPSTVKNSAKSTNLTAVITAAIAILLFALMVATSIKPLYNYFAGPFDVTAEELISYQGPGDTFRTSVTTHPNVALDTNFYYFENKKMAARKSSILIMRCCLRTAFCWQNIQVPGRAITSNPDRSQAGLSG